MSASVGSSGYVTLNSTPSIRREVRVGMRVVVYVRRHYREATVLELAFRYKNSTEADVIKLAFDDWWVRDGWYQYSDVYPLDGIDRVE